MLLFSFERVVNNLLLLEPFRGPRTAQAALPNFYPSLGKLNRVGTDRDGGPLGA